MKAAQVKRYGPPGVVDVGDVPEPRVRAGEVLVRVEAVAVTAGDARIRAARFPSGFGWPARLAFGVTRPRRAILGGAFSGVVAATGPGVEGFSVGDRVSGMNGARLGAHAELVAVRADRLAPTPAGVSAEDAAGIVFGGTTALYFLRDRARVRAGESVLVVGASGSVGSAAVQLAALVGAHVTAVTSGGNAEFVRSLGAERVVDYTTSQVNGHFDVVIDAVGAVSRRQGMGLLADGGRLVLVVGSLAETIRARGAVIAGAAPERRADIEHLLGLLAEGRLNATTRVLGGLDAIREAYELVDSGRKVGNVVIRPAA